MTTGHQLIRPPALFCDASWRSSSSSSTVHGARLVLHHRCNLTSDMVDRGVAESISPDTGLFYPPTLVTNVQSSSTLVQEEIFGPVANVEPVATA